jgi:hypothetical protein
MYLRHCERLICIHFAGQACTVLNNVYAIINTTTSTVRLQYYCKYIYLSRLRCASAALACHTAACSGSKHCQHTAQATGVGVSYRTSSLHTLQIREQSLLVWHGFESAVYAVLRCRKAQTLTLVTRAVAAILYVHKHSCHQ